MKALGRGLERLFDWVENGGGWTAFAFFVGVLCGLSLMLTAWSWATFWTSVAAVANVALAYATFSVIRRDSKTAELAREPGLAVSDVDADFAEGRVVITVKIVNLGRSYVHVLGAVKKIAGFTPNTKQRVGVTIPIGQIGNASVTLPFIKIGDVEFKFLFYVGASTNSFHRFRVFGRFVKGEDGTIAFVFDTFKTEPAAKPSEEDPDAVLG